jgi:ABC-type antimicrobial peptide transport system permease subunit
MLSAMLLYSLMLSDVDSKTYEYGMLRALGFRKRMLVGMIIEQSFSFSLPGIFLGVIIAWIFNVLLR